MGGGRETGREGGGLFRLCILAPVWALGYCFPASVALIDGGRGGVYRRALRLGRQTVDDASPSSGEGGVVAAGTISDGRDRKGFPIDAEGARGRGWGGGAFS